MHPIQENGRKEMLTDDQPSSWKKAMNIIQSRNTEMLTDE